MESKGIELRAVSGSEYATHCFFNDCDKDSRPNEQHLHINLDKGLYHCKKCNASGNFLNLIQHFGDQVEQVFKEHDIEPEEYGLNSPQPPVQQISEVDYVSQEEVERYQQNLPPSIIIYLKERGISDQVIRESQLGWGRFYDRSWITIPIFDQNGQCLFFKLRKDPQDISDAPRYMVYPKSTGVTLYCLNSLTPDQEEITICEGELDRLALLSQGIPAVTSTGGASTFREEWCDYFHQLKRIRIALDKDEVGCKATEKLVELFQRKTQAELSVVIFPQEMNGKDVTDYFIRNNGTKEEFLTQLSVPVSLDQSSKYTFSELTAKDLTEVLGLTIKRDNENKLVAFLCMLSAYTDDSQFNISFNAPSSTGKSYIPVEIARLFPKTDVVEIGYVTPTAFFHDSGEFDKEKQGYLVDLSRKVMIFLDQPHTSLLERLRPLLSHDQKEMHLKITDKNQKFGLRTKNVFVKGFPAVVFCSAGVKIDEQEGTRFILLSPETTQEKLRDSISERIKRETDKDSYSDTLEENPQRRELKARIEAIKEAQIKEVKIADVELIQNLFFKNRETLKPRHQRDIGRFISLVKVLALLNLWHRTRENGTLFANQSDINEAFTIWQAISESQEHNVPPFIYEIYKDVIVPTWQEKKTILEMSHISAQEIIGVTRQEIMKAYFAKKKRTLPASQWKSQVLPALEATGLIIQEPNPKDKREHLIIPVVPNSPEEKYIAPEGGVLEPELDLSVLL
jgi:DNA primase